MTSLPKLVLVYWNTIVANVFILYTILTNKTCLFKLGLTNENQPKKNVQLVFIQESFSSVREDNAS